MKERSLVIIKPDAIERKLVGEIISRIERTGLDIIEMKMITADDETLIKHYNKDEKWMLSIGERTIKELRERGYNVKELLGTTDPLSIGKKAYKELLNYMKRGPIIVMVVQGYHAVEVMRKICGSTNPKDALPGTIRGDFSSTSGLISNALGTALENLIHTSESVEEAEREISIWQKYLSIA